MNNTITGREELLLAKIAGEDVDISTMTPPVAMNKKEKLLLDIADRFDEIGKSGKADSTLFAVEGTIGQSENEKITLTMSDVTAAEGYAAISDGRLCKLTVAVGNMTSESIFQIFAVRLVNDDSAVYKFRMVNEQGKGFSSNNLSESDTIVLIEE